MNSSEEDFEQQWDDMAIVRAFEKAMLDQHTRDYTITESSSGKHMTRSTGKMGRRSDDNKEVKEQYEYGKSATFAATGKERHGHPNRASFAGFSVGSEPFASDHQQQQQQASSDVYQAAYTQAYAHFQARLQAVFSAAVPQQPYEQAPAFTAPSACSPPLPPPPAMPTPFAGMPGSSASIPGAIPSATGSDDGLANVLLAWYQSGYCTGRFQAMQEMKLLGRR